MPNCTNMVIVNGRTMVCVNPEPESTKDHCHWYKHVEEAIAYSYHDRKAIENV